MSPVVSTNEKSYNGFGSQWASPMPRQYYISIESIYLPYEL